MNLAAWLIAIAAGVAPRRWWPALERHLPLRSAAAVSGLATLTAGFGIGVGGFFTFATRLAGANNDWMLARLGAPAASSDAVVGLVPYGMSALTLFIFLLFTPTGLLALYLGSTGLLRAVSAYFDDPHGDPVLTALDRAAATLFEKNRRERRQIARERLEGADAVDVLRTGQWAGLRDIDYVVLAARRKTEWTAGAIVMTSDDWYKLGVPFDLQTPAGLRTAYPLKKMESVEVVRRGIRYDLPPLRHSTPKPRNTLS